MKKLTIAALIASIALSTPFTSLAATKEAPKLEHYYPQTFIVYEIDREYDIIYLMTPTGSAEFEYEGVEDWHAGDIASAIMYDNGTSKINDDTIVTLQYDGTIDEF